MRQNGYGVGWTAAAAYQKPNNSDALPIAGTSPLIRRSLVPRDALTR